MARKQITEERLRQGSFDAAKYVFEEICKSMKLKVEDNKVKLKCSYKGTAKNNEPLHSNAGTVENLLTYTSTTIQHNVIDKSTSWACVRV